MLTTSARHFRQLLLASARYEDAGNKAPLRASHGATPSMIAATIVLALLALLIATEPDHTGPEEQVAPDNVRRPTRPRRHSDDQGSRDPCRRAA
jgi:hypothetical protein